MTSLIPLLDPQAPGAPHILQLAQDLELFSEGDPPANTLFVLGRVARLSPDSLIQTQLLIVDPPHDVTRRFRLDGDVAVLFTGEPVDVGLAQVQTQAGGVAHVRVGDHFLDLYAEPGGTIVYLPALGVLLGGGFGSDTLPPILVAGSDGSAEMDVLRLLARMLKTQHFQLFAPQVGSLVRERQAVMARLAEDVGYLHGLRRIAPALAQRQEPLETVERIAESLLPVAWRSEQAQLRNINNLVALVAALQKQDPQQP